MHLMIDGRRLQGQLTGIGIYVHQYVRRLPAVRPDWRISVLVTPEAREYLKDVDGITLQTTPYSFEDHLLGDPWRQVMLPAFLRRWGVDVFHGPGYFIPWVCPGVKTVVTIHDITPFRFPESNSFKFNLYMRLMTRMALKTADLVLTDSEFVRSELLFELRGKARKIRTCPLGVDEVYFRPLPEEEIDRVLLHYGLRRPFLFTNALIEPRKNLECLLIAYKACLERDPTFPLDVVIGGRLGWKSDDIATLLDLPLLRSRVHMTGFLRGVEQRAVYQGSAAYVLPSLYEGFGLPVLEALASGTRLICAEAGSLPEVAGDVAWYFNPLDPPTLAAQLRRVPVEPDTRHEHQRRRARAYRFLWEHSLRRYCEILEELVTASPRASASR